jgi:hypothetical protein
MARNTDKECVELALRFLEACTSTFRDHEIYDLAESIQDTIEDWLFDRELYRSKEKRRP